MGNREADKSIVGPGGHPVIVCTGSAFMDFHAKLIYETIIPYDLPDFPATAERSGIHPPASLVMTAQYQACLHFYKELALRIQSKSAVVVCNR